ncbi:MAG: hypothetical protein COU35_04300 [Candidatus Magasanikbacteria bacterium CG10_big_fil_rev_8_21_14_0_10_47_10]|uniref:Peptidase S11 D-alanyl-D-alanine carboxypeptidase A N-terminal domain-containing protein n=1 Tax=Candidatus Magasanikbacteria bacterium CG10_big_fil_rev_8_21_14_0_10_47_10 TaxID=1974652 RepID=A0A2H0TPF6_9BACT|nr:MAG: hypothetical protein COU35_04300 [Candidatus Magasanikbacteria bacterium CG10_big_fil_rev_8_21_14_0_10_47_10]
MNFLEIEQYKATKKRQYLSGFFVVIIVFFGLAMYEIGRVVILRQDSPLQTFSHALTKLDTIYGGDIHAAAPVPEPPKLPVQIADLPGGEIFTAQAMLVKDVSSGTVLYSKNAYEQRPIASLTKLMSALVVLERNPDWATSTQVVADDLIDTHMYAGDTYTLRDLWNAALIGSSNKAIMTVSDAVGWSREAFVSRMNTKAQELGMGDSIFFEPTGLDQGDVSTASDLSLLLDEALLHPSIRQGLLTHEYNLYSEERDQAHHLWNTNWLLLGWVPNRLFDIIGGKTGYIGASGYNFMMQAQDEAGHVVSVVVLGADSHEARFTEARDIAQTVFENVVWPDDPDYESKILDSQYTDNNEKEDS